nr:unnamed protein product [Callosobruchus analis]
MDDLLSGAASEEDGIQLAKQVFEILKAAGFVLGKWKSNSPVVMEFLRTLNNPISDQSSSDKTKPFGEYYQSKTLGLYWDSEHDTLKFKVNISKVYTKVTKRVILLEIASIFDPMGLLSPSIIIAKILLQGLWQANISWDDEIPEDILNKWNQFRHELPLLNDIEIKRHVLCHNPVYIELHGFSGASIKAYGAVIYIRSIDVAGKIHVSILCSKSKVAPIKSLTTPKLELCGALVLSQLVKKVQGSFSIRIDNVCLWSDSQVVLSWIHSTPNQFQIFVANRIAQIQTLTCTKSWRYIKTSENPADLVSRGVFPSKLLNNPLWLYGPAWLKENSDAWNDSSFEVDLNPPAKKKSAISLVAQAHMNFIEFTRFSSFTKLKRVCAFVLYFIHNLRNTRSKKSGPLSSSELFEATKQLVKLSQRDSFSEEIVIFDKGKELPKSSHILKLSPFLDSEKILRVGGRIQLSSLEYSKKHPMLMSSKHYITQLLFKYEHVRLCHASPKLLVSSLRDLYRVTGSTSLAKQTVYNCIKCFRVKPRASTPIMGVLPKSRVTPQPPFL